MQIKLSRLKAFSHIIEGNCKNSFQFKNHMKFMVPVHSKKDHGVLRGNEKSCSTNRAASYSGQLPLSELPEVAWNRVNVLAKLNGNRLKLIPSNLLFFSR